MLLKESDLRNRLIRLAGYGQLTTATKALDEAGQRISRYLRMQSIINGSFGLGVFLIGVPYALLWGFLAAVFRFIPYVGPGLATLLPSALSLAVFPGWWQPVLVIGLIALLELMNYMVLEPWLYGQSAGVSEVALLVTVAFWTWLWGPVGLLLATPMTVCLSVLSKYIPPLDFINTLLGDEPALDLPTHYYQRLLDPRQYALELVSPEMLTAEVVSLVGQQAVELICIAALPPGTTTPTRYLCKRLRTRFPACKILVGRWGWVGDPDTNRVLLLAAGADAVGLTLRESANQVRQWATLEASPAAERSPTVRPA